MLDLATLLVGYCATTLILSLALLLAARSQRRFPGLELWSLGGLFIGTAPLQLTLQERPFGPLQLVTITLAVITGMACLSAGMARYTASRFRLRLYLALALVWLGFVALAVWLRPPLHYAVSLLAALVGVMASETGMQLVRRRRLMEIPAHRVTAGLFLLLALGAAVRAVAVLFFQIGVPSFGTPVIQPLGLLGFQALHNAIGMSLLVMVWARLDREIQAHVGTLEEQVGCDPLTGALNRRGFWGCAEPLLEEARRSREPISVICLDLDHFKRVNDSYGHTVGDEVLKALVHCIRGHLRANDHLTRLGGEEFSLILPETTLEGAMALAERLRISVQDTPVRHEEGVIQYTCSFGAAQRLQLEESLDSMLNRADRALYEAKRSGRNQVRAATESAPTPMAVL
jgi:diguanylate cyclase (GGDEF)-like protein